MHLSPGANLAGAIQRLRDGEPLILAEGGRYVGGFVEGHRGAIRVVGNGASIAGGLKFQECGPVTLDALLAPDSPHHGFMFVRCASLTLSALRGDRAQGSGILTANCSRVSIEGSGGDECLEHGIYLSQSGDHLELRGNLCKDNHAAGIQVNATEDHPNRDRPRRDGLSKHVLIQANILHGNQKGAFNGAALNLAGVVGARIVANHILDHEGNMGVALWDDDDGPNYGCREVRIERNTFAFAEGYGRACVSVARYCSEITIGQNRWAPGVPDVDSAVPVLRRAA